MSNVPGLNALQEYWLDAWQRSVLFLDVLRQRGNNHFEYTARAVPNVLSFECTLVRDGRTLPRPVNYGLVQIVPPAGTKTDPTKRPFIVVDPRAGHGPGIGGMKHDSEIGVALAAGHPCYFIGFAPHPVPGQTVEDVCRAEAAFVAEVIARHPEAEGRPVIIGNCQAGWQIMMMAAIEPQLCGPIMLAGSPLSYWAGVRGRNPMRYTGGILGGSWMTALAGDLGHGIFDGAHLVANFESLNLANTYWKKDYNLYSRIDTEATRFLEFEKWWGSPILLNAEEIQWIVDNLFIGNRLSTGELRSSDQRRVDLRNVKSPIIVFCSWGDNITPPQQALDWILDLYDDEREIVANGQTIVYSMHSSVGHLGIFVSGKVATKEHEEFATCMDMIDLMPPGLYEAVITEVEPGVVHPNLVNGRYLFTLEVRTLNDIRALGSNDAEDDLRFATVARVSEVNHGLYQTTVGPAVRMMTPEPAAALMRELHPHRMRYALFSDRNPLMQPVKAAAEAVRAARQPVAEDNPLLAAERAMSSWIVNWLDACQAARDTWVEHAFLAVYGSPLLQALAGFGPQAGPARPHIERDLVREADEAQRLAALETRIAAGGPMAAGLRAVLYVRMPEGSADERGFAILQALRAEQPPERRPSIASLKELFKEQFLLLKLDEERAVAAIPRMLPAKPEERRQVLGAVQRMLSARGSLSEEGTRRLRQIETLFDAKPPRAPAREEAVNA